jgi:hypothetical protein
MKALYEVRVDLRYIKEFKGEMITYDEGPARKKMAQLKQKGESRTPIEEQELDAILDTIAESKAVKNEWNQSLKLEEDLLKYLALL